VIKVKLAFIQCRLFSELKMDKDKEEIKKEMDRIAMEQVVREKMVYKRKLLAEMFN